MAQLVRIVQLANRSCTFRSHTQSDHGGTAGTAGGRDTQLVGLPASAGTCGDGPLPLPGAR